MTAKRKLLVVGSLRTLALGVIILWGSAFAFAEETGGLSAQVDSYMRKYAKMGDFSGNLLIVKGGQVLVRKSYGQANYELGVANIPDGRFHLASVSKTFTAAAVMLLAQQGKIHISDPLGRYLPDFPNANRITIEELLDHRAGVPDLYGFPDYAARKRMRLSLEELIEWIARFPLDFEPGSKDSYSNSGYALLAAVIQKISGEPYCDFLQHNIFAPLKMGQTGCYTDDDLITERATGYNDWFGRPGLRNTPYYDKSILIGSGNLYSSVGDLYRWYQAVKNKTLFDATAPPGPFGWGVREHKGRRFIVQDGRDPGFVARIEAYLQDDLCIILLGNIEVGALESMSADLASLVFGEPIKIPEARPTSEANHDNLQDFVGRYIVRDGFFLDIKLSGGNLYLRGTGGYFLPLHPVGKDNFFYKQLYVRIRFRRQRDGKIDALLWPGDYVCERVSDTPDLSYDF